MDIEARQLAKKRQLLAMKEVLDGMGIPFWLHSGVLLGYYRGRDLIEHDPDLDLGILRPDIPRDFCYKLAKRLEGTGMRIGWRTDTCLKIYPEDGSPYCGSHCDIFIHDIVGDELELVLRTDGTRTKYTYPFNGFVKARFLGEEFDIPANAKEYIYAQYGPGWQTPVKQFVWDKDPTNIEGKRRPLLDEHPASNVITKQLASELVEPIACLGPLTEADINLLGDVCVYSTQSFDRKKIKNVEFDHVRCDETHYDRDMNEAFGTVLVPHPELYNEHNMRALLERAQDILEDGGKLVFCGNPPHFVEDYMFEKTDEKTWKKYNESEDWVKNVTAVIVTYESPDMVEGCVRSFQKFNIGMRLIVADNSRKPRPVEGARLLPLPEDSGLSYSRNAGVREARTPYVLIMDDDQWLTDPMSVKKMYDSLRNNKLDIVGGDVINSATGKGNLYSGASIVRNVYGVVLRTGARRTYPDGTLETDLAVNFLLAKRSTFMDVGWRNELKLHEHLDFFLRVQDRGYKVGVLKAATCSHRKNPGVRTPEYRAKRGRVFRSLMMRLNGLTRIDQFGTVYTYESADAKPAPKPPPAPKLPKPARPVESRPVSLVVKFPGLFQRKAPGAGKGRNPAPGA